MSRDSDRFAWLPAVLAAVTLVGFVAAFSYELVSYQRLAVDWANGDINSRAHLAAANLAEPLRTQDFRAIREIGAACERDGVHMLVTSDRGGVVFSSQSRDSREAPFYSERCQCGEYWVSIGMPNDRVMAPFRRAVRGFLLAGLVGVAGVMLFFFVTYRQRVYIRELKRLERFRSEFIADISHEIKTPLTGILGAVDLLEGDSPLIPLIRRESQRLNRLVQSILDLARLEREGETIDLAETDLVELVREVASRYPCKCAAEGRCIVRCDAQLVAQALENLLANAVRHSGSDDISVTLTLDGSQADVVVEDHGIGIPPEEAERVFERFHRVDPARAAETGGAGLGLAIVRRIAQLNGGEVVLSATRPHGCRFTLSLPASSNCLMQQNLVELPTQSARKEQEHAQ